MTKPETYKFFADLIFKHTGIFYPEKDFYRLDTRVNSLVKHFECRDSCALKELFAQNTTADMLTLLLDLSTNNETYFFRDNKPFEALSKNIIPEILERNGIRSPIHIWSCASSTGQEALSILMSVKENCPTVGPSQVLIDATDISTKALKKAKEATYTNLDVQRGLPVTLLMKYFSEAQEEGCWKANHDLISNVNYHEFNLLTGNFPFQKYEIIYCRNVLIYQNQENKSKILNNLYNALKPGGYLLMGAGESLIGCDVEFTLETLSGMMVFRKEASKIKKVA